MAGRQYRSSTPYATPAWPPIAGHGLFLKPAKALTMKTMKCVKTNKHARFFRRIDSPSRNVKFFMNFMVDAAEVRLQEKTMNCGS